MSLGNKLRRGTWREKIWKTIRATDKPFTSREIAELTGAGLENIKRYITALKDAGYLRARTVRQDGRRFYYEYHMIRNTGPKPPIQKELKMLFDPNTGEYWAEDPSVRIALDEKRTRNEKQQ